MNEIGFTRAGESWKWRGRRGPPANRREAASHAFAELEKLRKK
jgi:ATP-dependent RNA helicase SUPV3L1/SUV3